MDGKTCNPLVNGQKLIIKVCLDDDLRKTEEEQIYSFIYLFIYLLKEDICILSNNRREDQSEGRPNLPSIRYIPIINHFKVHSHLLLSEC
jgi:hypothetical protein